MTSSFFSSQGASSGTSSFYGANPTPDELEQLEVMANETEASMNAAAASAAAALVSENNAETAETNAETAQAAAEAALAATLIAKAAAELAEANAELAEANAETAETNAETAQAAAAASASAAATSASAASTSASNAATSATAAQTAKTAAETAETNAELAETNAETAQAAAELAAANAAAAATAALATKVTKTGDTMTGNLAFSDNGEGVTFSGTSAHYDQSGYGHVTRAYNDTYGIWNQAGSAAMMVFTASGFSHVGNTAVSAWVNPFLKGSQPSVVGYTMSASRFTADAGTGGSCEITGSGEATRTGWLEWRRQNNDRVAYMGYVLDGDNAMDFVFEASNGTFRVSNGGISTSSGYLCRAGYGGAAGGNWFNFNWTGSALDAWIDGSNQGTVPVGLRNTQWGVAKTVVKFNTAGAIQFNVNVSSVTDNGVGAWTVNHNFWFANADYVAIANCGGTGAAEGMSILINATPSTSACMLVCRNDAGLAKDPTTPASIFAAFYGTST